MVISRSVDVGQTVAASLQAPVLFTIAEDLTKMHIEASVPESDVGRLAVGMPVEFTVDAFPGQRFKGTIEQVRNADLVIGFEPYHVAAAVVDGGAARERSFLLRELAGILAGSGGDHVEVDADAAVGVLQTDGGGDGRPPVATLSAEALVAEGGHQLGPRVGDAPDVPARRGRLVAEPIAGEVEQHDAIKELGEPLEHLVERERGLGEAVQQ